MSQQSYEFQLHNTPHPESISESTARSLAIMSIRANEAVIWDPTVSTDLKHYATALHPFLIDQHRELLKLEESATTDPLTKLGNRRAFYEDFDHAVQKTNRRNEKTNDATSLVLMYIDIDNFKTVNDSYGHAGGDQILVDISERLQKNIRVYDKAYRFGGDEFVLLLEDVAQKDIQKRSDEIKNIIGEAILVHQTHLVSVSASIGFTHLDYAEISSIAVMDPEQKKQKFDELKDDADKAMYENKQRRINEMISKLSLPRKPDSPPDQTIEE